MGMDLYKLVNSEEIMDAAFSQPSLRYKPASTKRPTIETLTKAVMLEIESAVVRAIAGQVKEKLAEEYENYELLEGEYELAEDKEAWEDGVDQMIEEVIQPWVPVLSQNWLGQHTIAAGLHLEGGVDRFCDSLGREYWKQITHDNDSFKQAPAVKIMSSAGIVQATLAERLEKHNNLTPKEKETMSDNQNAELDAALQKIADYIGKDYNANSVLEDLDLASDEDELLAQGAAPRLGLDADDVIPLQGERVIYGDETPDMLLQRIDELVNSAGKKKAPKKVKAKTEGEESEEQSELPPFLRDRKVKKTKKNPEANADEAEGNIDPSVLTALKNCGAVDNDMAKGIGVSRATYNNYANGKSEFSPSSEQYSFIRGEIVDRINALHEALAKVDGLEEPEVVF